MATNTPAELDAILITTEAVRACERAIGACQRADFGTEYVLHPLRDAFKLLHAVLDVIDNDPAHTHHI